MNMYVYLLFCFVSFCCRELSQECRAELLDLQQRSARGEESDQENISGNCRVEIATVLSQFQGKEGAKAEEQGAAGQAQDDPPNNFVHPTYVLLGTVLAGLAAVSYIVYQKYEELQQKTPEERKREEKRLRKREKKGKVVNTE